MHRITCFLIGAAVVLCATPAHTFPIELKFKGEVTSTFFDPFDPFAGSIAPNTSIVGSYTFESTTPDAIPDSSVGSYSNFGFPFGMNVGIGGISFATNEFLNVGVANDIGGGLDQYTVLGEQGQPFVDPEALLIQVFFEDPTGLALSDDRLPLAVSDLSDFTFGSFFLDGVRIDNDGTLFQFQIQGSIMAVPEPHSILLFMVGLFGLGIMRRHRQR